MSICKIFVLVLLNKMRIYLFQITINNLNHWLIHILIFLLCVIKKCGYAVILMQFLPFVVIQTKKKLKKYFLPI